MSTPPLLESLEPRQLLTAGGLDPSFGQSGVVATDFIGRATAGAGAVLVQPDGKTIVAGSTRSQPSDVPSYDYTSDSDAILVRFNADGSIDSSFGQAGKVQNDFGDSLDSFTDLALLTDGRFVAAGVMNNQSIAVRFLANGQVDPTFGTGGVASIGVPAYDQRIALAPDGGIIIAGGPSSYEIYIVRLTPRGQVDRSFGTNGSVQPPVDSGTTLFENIAVRPDGRIVVGLNDSYYDRFYLQEFTADGKPYTAFAQNGRLSTRIFAGTQTVSDIAIDSAGRILVLSGVPNGLAVARFKPNGTLDRTFGIRGVATAKFDAAQTAAHAADDLVLQPDGRILAVGRFAVADQTYRAIGVIRLTSNGALDTTFDKDGIVLRRFERGAHGTAELNVAQAATEEIVITGDSGGDLSALRLRSNGAIDTSFNATGTKTVAFQGSTSSDPIDMVHLPDGKFLAAGKDGDDHVVLRYLASGALDTTYGQQGRARVAGDIDNSAIRSIAALPSGKIIVAINPYSVNATGRLYRLNADGTPDISFGTGGVINHGTFISNVLADSAGRLLVTGAGIQVRRLLTDGTLDTSYGRNGISDDVPTSQLNDLKLLADGSLVAVGTQGNSEQERWVIARFTPNGLLDSNFAANGVATNPVDLHSSPPRSIDVDSQGRFIVGGYSPQYDNGQAILARFTANGALDPTFGDDGMLINAHTLISKIHIVTNVFAMPDGKIVAVGYRGVFREGHLPFTYEVVVERYNTDGTLDPSFGDWGTVMIELGRDDRTIDAAVTPDGQLLVLAKSEQPATALDFVLAKYLLTDPAPISATLNGGTLTITGTPADDHIALRKTGDQLEVRGLAQRFPFASISRIEIHGQAGNDTLDASASYVPVFLNGGDGNDSLLGSGHADSLDGGAGNDTLFGGKGNDTLRGGAGNDYLNAGPGRDAVFGDAGNDQILSLDLDADFIDAGSGFDHIRSDVLDRITATEGPLG